MNVVFTSFGNDSVALIQWAIERKLQDVWLLYSDTGWAHPAWPLRIRAILERLPYRFVHLTSVGMVELVKQKKAWPRNGLQFCTEHLKIKPALEWLNAYDPKGEATCIVGIRREESARRRSFPEWTEESERHGGRSLWAPLVNHTKEMRDRLLNSFGISSLAHRSQECFPCINSNRAQLRLLTEDRIALIENLEKEMGITSNGKPRTMFRPYRHQGAVGIREVLKWANSERGGYVSEEEG